MGAKGGFADSVFTHGGDHKVQGMRLWYLALAGMALALVPVLVLAGLAWYAALHSEPATASAALPWLIAGVALFLGLYAMFLGWLANRWVVAPLRELARGMRAISQGNYPGTTASGEGRVREVEQLRRGLHSMWQGLERRRNERDAALLASDAARQRMHGVLDQMDEGFMILDGEWNLKYCNPRGAQLVLKPGGSLVGLPFWDLFPDEKMGGRRERCQRELEHGRNWVVEDYHSRYRRWLELRLSPSSGGIGVFVRDVSERRQLMDELVEREQRYRELFEANPNVMWIFDTETLRFLGVNGAAIARYGYSREEFLAMSITDIRPPEDVAGLTETLQDKDVSDTSSLSHGARIWRHVTKDGAVILVEVARHPIQFQGRSARLVMVNDITARLLAESRLRQRHEKLSAEHSEASRTLKAAQQVVAGYARLLGDDVLPLLAQLQAGADAAQTRQRAGQLERLLRAAQRLTQVPVLPFRPATVDLSAIAHAEIQQLRLAQPQYRVHVEIAPDLRCEGDEVLLRLLLQAVLDNAWKFSARGHDPWIRMARLEREDSPEASFFVSDSGIGFDEAQQGRAYLPFERLHSEAEYEGLGLGLAVARAVVARHGGRLWARSSLGQGATFCFELAPRPQNDAFHVSEVVIDSLPSDDD
ncbi:PAS domain S-box protein [uncultured Ramlibacter sp.]|uniref:sensor histidine kinase n=1 Tax=uncultured Ramlibacter sp. TaxID=260755 RepID=UPI002621C69F|nr:PAS domain S-box protein [uncultured Ramlibacter sp.]